MTETNLSLNVQVSNYQPSLSAQQIFDKVVDIVCAYYRADKKIVLAGKRDRIFTQCRMMSVQLTHCVAPALTLKQLGALFPKPQDHSTVINTKYNWGNLMSSDEKFAADWLQLHILVESNLRRKIAQTPKQVTPCEDKKRKQIKLNLDKAKQIVERQLLQVSLKRAELLAKLEKFNDTPELKKKLYQIQIEKSLV